MNDIIDYTLSIFSTCWSIENIDSVLGIVLLILSVINLLYKCIYQIIGLIKEKKFDNITDVIEETIEDIENLKEGK